MPTYRFLDKKTEELVLEDTMTISEMEQKLADNPGWTLAISAPSIGDPMRLGVTKPDRRFRDEVLKPMKNFYKGNTIGD